MNYLLGQGRAVATQFMLSVAFWCAWHDAAVSSRSARLRFCTFLYAEPLLTRSRIRVAGATRRLGRAEHGAWPGPGVILTKVDDLGHLKDSVLNLC